MKRALTPEYLDHLPWDAPEARASRRDLQHLNRFMGNYSYVARQLRQRVRPGEHCLEIGAGDGLLGRCLSAPDFRLTGLDRVPRPDDWPPAWGWTQADLFEPGRLGGVDVLAGVLVLHHFDDYQLATLGRAIGEGIRCLVLVEPSRRWSAHVLGGLAEIRGIHRVTRHDMHASIRAGFRRGELPAALGLDSRPWTVQEREDWRGSLRMVAYRHG